MIVDEYVPEPEPESDDRRPYRTRRRTCISLPVKLTGPWEDIGNGTCQRCDTKRRLYSPAVFPKLRVCSKCTQVYANSGLVDRGDDVAEEEAA